jgi:putative membrane protein
MAREPKPPLSWRLLLRLFLPAAFNGGRRAARRRRHPRRRLRPEFRDRAALGTGTEVELGRLASTRAVSPAVRAFADRIITDHRQAHARLTRTERSTHIAAMPALPPPNALTALSGPQFDRAFMQDQIKNHQEAIQLFQAEAQTGQDPRLRKYASDMLPMLYRNLQQAQAITARLGG